MFSYLLENEIRALEMIGPNSRIIQLFETFTTSSHQFLVYELCEGGSLEAKIKRLGRLPDQEALEIIRGLILALNDLSNFGIVHRDIKTDNVLFKNGLVKLADFGLCKIPTRPEKRVLIGSPSYLPPESLSSHEYDQKTDVYTLGVLLFEIVTGNGLF
jgi:serine/threonine protein kinase